MDERFEVIFRGMILDNGIKFFLNFLISADSMDQAVDKAKDLIGNILLYCDFVVEVKPVTLEEGSNNE